MQKSREIPTINDLPDPKYQDLDYPELLEVCSKQEIKLSDNEITQIKKDTRTQSQGANFFKHRAGRIGASQSKQVSHTDPDIVTSDFVQLLHVNNNHWVYVSSDCCAPAWLCQSHGQSCESCNITRNYRRGDGLTRP